MARTIVPVARATIVAPAERPVGFYGLRRAAANRPPLAISRGSQLGKQCVAKCTEKGGCHAGFPVRLQCASRPIAFFPRHDCGRRSDDCDLLSPSPAMRFKTRKGMIPSLSSWQIITAAILFIWLSFTLHSMRIRDIGWDPVCVIPGWIAVAIIDGARCQQDPGHCARTSTALERSSARSSTSRSFSPCCFGQAASTTIRAPTSGGPFRMPDLPSRGPAADRVTCRAGRQWRIRPPRGLRALLFRPDIPRHR